MKKGFLSGGGGSKAKPKKPEEEKPKPEHVVPTPEPKPRAAAPADPLVFVSERTAALVKACSSACARVEGAEGRGRAVFAAKGASAGDVVMIADCYATVVSDAMAKELCSRCFAEGAKSRCVGCASVFCSEGCLQEAGAEHAAECYALSMLPSLKLNTDSESARLALRALARRGVEAPAELGELHYRDVEELMSHRLWSARSGLWEKKVADARALVKVLPPPCADVGVEGCAELLLRIQYNAHPITDWRSRRTGVGLYPAACLANHSCAPNATISFTPGGGELVMRCARGVRAGEEICYAYMDVMQPKGARRGALEDAYGFAWRVVCGECGAGHEGKDLRRCVEEALRRLKSGAELLATDPMQCRGELTALLQSPEADRLSRSHHVIHQASLTLALVCRQTGDEAGRCEALQAALSAQLSWDPPPSLQLASLHLSLGIALAKAKREGGGTEVERALALQRLCLGGDSAAVRSSEKVLQWVRAGDTCAKLVEIDTGL